MTENEFVENTDGANKQQLYLVNTHTEKSKIRY